MMGELNRQQGVFVELVARLITWAYEQGFTLTFGEAHRSRATAAANAAAGTGIAHSLHVDRLAIDFNLFRDGVWLANSEAHEPLGVFWESLHPLCRWGGRFAKPDGNHYSMEWEGRR